MRRSLVLTREGARHRFRASLPAAVKLRRKPVSDRSATDDPARSGPLIDTRGVVGTYFAATLAVFVFIM